MSKRVLVIDDDKTIRFLIAEVLKSADYEVVEAADGEDGIAEYNKEPTDLVITDIMMEKSGIEVISELKQGYPEIKIVAITSGSAEKQSDLLRMAKILGATATLYKPFKKEELLAIVENALGA